jgi:hypothetical protein
MLISIRDRLPKSRLTSGRLPLTTAFPPTTEFTAHFSLGRLTWTSRRLMIKFFLATDCKHPGHMPQTRIIQPEARPVQTERAVGTLPDNRGSPLAGDTRQTALAHGV